MISSSIVGRAHGIVRRSIWMLACATAASCLAVPASAESLDDALISAYQLNPNLSAERARLRATDENVPIAKSQTRPTVFGDADTGYEKSKTRFNRDAFDGNGGGVNGIGGVGGAGGTGGVGVGGGTATTGTGGTASTSRSLEELEITNPHGYGIEVTQPIFRGLRALNSIRQADANVAQGRESLRAIEQQTLLDAVTAYVDLVRDQAIVRLNENNVKVLSEQLKATQDRFEVGEVTRTDVAQAEARRAGAISELSLAQGNLKASRANYERIIGHPPSNVVDPPSIARLLPANVVDAASIGDVENPDILAGVSAEKAALHAVNVIIGELLPEVSVEARYQDRFELSDSIRGAETTTVIGRLTVPFYQRGEVAARTRQAKEVHFQLQRQLEQTRLNIRAEVVSAFGALTATRAQIVSAQSQVEANRVALAGVREEARVGQRTTLDVLNAELEYLNSQVDLVTFKRDTTVAEYGLLSAVGRLSAPQLGLQSPYYDPGVHYDLVRNKWFGLNPAGVGQTPLPVTN